MRKLMMATAFSGALLFTGGLALAQTTSTTGTTGHSSGTMSTSPGTSSSMSSNNGSDRMSSSTTATGHRMTSNADVKQQLQAEGYSDITNIKRNGDHYTANAKQNGESLKLRVDASNGMVSKERS